MKTLLNTKFLLVVLSFFLVIGCTDDSPSIRNENSTGVDGSGGGTGQGGSLARFTIANNHLYIVTQEALFSYSLANASSPEFKSEIPIFTNAETIYAMGDYLFLGTQNGVEILNIANPSLPKRVSTYEHITSCDPVVARGKYAYSTLRTGTNCNRGVNLLDVINITNPANPYAETSLAMENPKGLGLSGDFLYICDNSKLKTYSITNPANPRFLGDRSLAGCFDVIGLDGRIIVVTTEGVSQFSVDNEGNTTLLSKITLD